MAVAQLPAQPTAVAQLPGQSMLYVRMPPAFNTVSKNTGLYVTVSDDGLGTGQFGYRRIYFKVHSPTPPAGDTQITVRACVSDWNLRRNTVSAEVDAVLPAGQTSVDVVVRIPQTTEWNQIWWDIWVDGIRDDVLSRDESQPQPLNDTGNSRWRTNQMLQLVASPDFRGILQQFFSDQSRGPGQSISRVQAKPSENWLDYTPLDIVSMDLRFLRRTAEKQPAQFAALDRWVRAGGNLWIEEVGDDWDALRDVHALFGWPDVEQIEPEQPAANMPPGRNGWSYVNLNTATSRDQRDGLVQNYDPQAASPDEQSAKANAEPIYSENWFIVRRHGWGTVTGFEYTFGSRPRNLAREQRLAAGEFWRDRSWPLRHGTVPGTANNDFSNWLIPGVGLAPVVSFQVLITLFVLAIGPLNYWLLKRAGRLHLMVITVPLAALAITIGLLGFGILSDGFATRVRAQSITLLDQTSGQGTSWSRLSYYAAFAPQQGLAFTNDTAVYAIHPGSVESYDVNLALAQRDLVWTDSQQRLTRGWLASRTPTQYLAIQPRKTPAELDFDLNDAGGGTVANRFDAKAQLIVVLDGDGQWRLAKDVEAGESGRLAAVGRSAAVAAVRAELSGREPQFPEGFAAVEDSPLLYDQQRRMRRQFRQQNMQYGNATASQSLLQQRWNELLGFSGSPALDLPPRSYVMISGTAPLPFSESDFAVEDSSVHLVIGSW